MAACFMFKAATDAFVRIRRHVVGMAAAAIPANRDTRRESLDLINRRALSEKILALQRAVAQSSAGEAHPLPKPLSFRIRVGKLVRARCRRRRFTNSSGYEKLELTEQDLEELADYRRHILAQKRIAKTLMQADRPRPRRRRVKLAMLFRSTRRIRISRQGKIHVLPPVITSAGMPACVPRSCPPLERSARIGGRIVSWAASKVELCRCYGRKQTTRVTCFPFDDNVPLLPNNLRTMLTSG